MNQPDIHAIPAYGRDYKSMREVKADWEAGKDFRDAMTNRYLSKRDFDTVPNSVQVWVRYAKLSRMTRVR